MAINGAEYISKLIEAIQTADELEFDEAFKKHLGTKGPYSAYLLDEQGERHHWLNMGCRSGEISLDTVIAIMPAMKRARIESLNFCGDYAKPTLAEQFLISLLYQPKETAEKPNARFRPC